MYITIKASYFKVRNWLVHTKIVAIVCILRYVSNLSKPATYLFSTL